MPSGEDIVLLASYNASMHEKLYLAAGTLRQKVLIAGRDAFFGAIHDQSWQELPLRLETGRL